MDGFAVWMRLAENQGKQRIAGSSTTKSRSVGARRLRQFIDKHHGMTPRKFGQWMRPPVHVRKVQRWLSGDGKPSFEEAEQIKDRTRIPVDSWAKYRQAAE